MKKKVIVILWGILMTILMAVILSSCASWDRAVTDIKSDFGGGLNRTIKVYTANGDLMAEYSGKIDIDMNDGGYIKFDYNGKRYIYYNCFIESIADK